MITTDIDFFWKNYPSFRTWLEAGCLYKINLVKDVTIYEQFRYRKVIVFPSYKRLLFARINIMYNSYHDYCKQHSLASFTSSELKRQLTEQPYYIGYNIKSQFDCGFKTNTSSYIIDLDMLLEKYPHLKSVK